MVHNVREESRRPVNYRQRFPEKGAAQLRTHSHASIRESPWLVISI